MKLDKIKEIVEIETTGEFENLATTVGEANDGINFFFSSGNIASGTFTLYKVI